MAEKKTSVDDTSKSERPVHTCLTFQGTGPGCDSCRVLISRYCPDWCESIPSLSASLQRKHPWLNREAIEIILNDTFMGVCNNIGSYLGESTFFTWVKSICDNKRIDYGKKALKSNPHEKLSIIPPGLIELCNKQNDSLTFYPSNKIGTLQVISTFLPDEVVNELNDISQSPSWQKALLKLKKKKNLDISKKNYHDHIVSICKKFPKNLLYKKCSPSGKLFAITPPLQSWIKDKLLELTSEKVWQDAINRLAGSTNFDNWREVHPPPGEDPGETELEDQDPAAPFDGQTNLDLRFLSLENKQFIQRLISLMEKLDHDCARLFRDLLEVGSDGEDQKKLAQRYGIPANTLARRKKRCFARITFHPNELRLVLPGDTIAILEITNKEQNGHVWCRIDGGTEIRSKGKLDGSEIERLHNDLESDGFSLVVIADQRARKDGNGYFFTFDFPEGRL